jgi:hypothetical protein
MGSVKLKDLKAFVRYDGSGRVVSGSLVFRKKKPKNGRWVEITKNECCTDNGTTTTTTTQSGGGGVTPTAFIKPYWRSEPEACNNPTFGDLLFYSSSTVLQPGVAIFSNAQLTIPILVGRVINVSMLYPRLTVGAGGVLSVLNC